MLPLKSVEVHDGRSTDVRVWPASQRVSDLVVFICGNPGGLQLACHMRRRHAVRQGHLRSAIRQLADLLMGHNVIACNRSDRLL